MKIIFHLLKIIYLTIHSNYLIQIQIIMPYLTIHSNYLNTNTDYYVIRKIFIWPFLNIFNAFIKLLILRIYTNTILKPIYQILMFKVFLFRYDISCFHQIQPYCFFLFPVNQFLISAAWTNALESKNYYYS